MSTLPSSVSEFDALPESALVALPVVAAITGRSRASIYRDVKAKRLPAPLQYSPGSVRWNVGELRAALKALREAA